MKIDELEIMDLQKYSDVMKVYQDVGSFLGNRYFSAAEAATKKFKGKADEDVLICAIAYSSLLNALAHIQGARVCMETDAIHDLIDGFIDELNDIKNAPAGKQ